MDDHSPSLDPNPAAPTASQPRLETSWLGSIGLGMLAGGGAVLLLGALLFMFNR